MKPETAVLRARAREELDAARRILALRIPRVAAREAYLAAFHAAQGAIFEATGSVPKTHSGLHSAFANLARGHAGPGGDLGRLLVQAYELKAITDYRPERTITVEIAELAVSRAETVVDRVSTWISARD